MSESLNQAVARMLVTDETVGYDVHGTAHDHPRILENGDVVWNFFFDSKDDEFPGEVLRSRHYVTVTRVKPDGFDAGTRFDWRESCDE